MLNRISNAEIIGISSPAGKSVELDRIVKRYDDFVAVDDISFELGRGEFLTLLGPSGSGKTSTLMMVAGFEKPTSGTIRVDGRDVVALSPQHRKFGVVFQGYALFPHMTALENVEFPLAMRHHARADRRRMALEMLDRVGLSSMTGRRPRELSGGQQQRVALARALVFQPDALLLDEPLGALDKNMRERMQTEIKELQRTLGVSVLFVTHDQDEAMSMSDRIAVMNEGKIVQIGSPKDVYKHPRSAFVASFLGETNMIACKVREPGIARAAITMDNGRTGLGKVSPDGPRFQQDQSALVSVRPEKVSILRPGEEADFVVDGVVTEHVFVGRHARIAVKAIGMTFIVSSGDADDVEIGSEVRLGWLADDAQILPG
jgi:putative spermidine/putrescine transport system ATP-binding protein